MGERGGTILKGVASVLFAALVATAPSGAEAAVGDVLRTVTIPAEADCGFEGSDFGSAVAIAPGGKAGFARIPVLLVTSCVAFVGEGSAATLFFIDPVPSPAVVVRTLPTTFTPDFGWEAAVLRADRGDVLACGRVTVFDGEAATTTTVLYAIDFSPFSAAADGTATFLRNAPAGATCAGVAWDPDDHTVYQSSTTADVLHFPETAGTLPPVPSGCPGPVAGIGVGGASLFVACPAPAETTLPATVRQLDKRNGALVRSFAAPAGTAEPGGVPDDPVTFGLQGRDALWTKDASPSSGQLLALEIPGGTLGQRIGPPALFPAACVGGATPDVDGDGLLDCWEDGALWPDGLPGIDFDQDGTRDLVLCVDVNGNGSFGAAGSAERAAECAHPRHRNIFVEIDYMQFHRPDPVAMNNVVQAFLNAPILNPDGTTGVRLHLQIDEQLPHTDRIALVPCTPAPAAGDADFDTLKAAFFGRATERGNPRTLNAKANAFNYTVFAHNQSGTGNRSSGCAEVPGNDSLITLGSFGGSVSGHTGGVGTTAQQAGTAMHEWGHNRGLRHGGGDNVNCKPNYASVMNYNRQLGSPLSNVPVDYSRQQLLTLNEATLTEAAGVGGFGGQIAFGPPVGIPPRATVVSGAGAVNWNRDGDSTDVVSQDINQLASLGCAASPGEVLEGYDDWANIQFNFRASIDFGAGHATIEEAFDGGTLELTKDIADELSLDADADGVFDIDDNCPGTFNADQADSAGDGIGDACRLVVRVLRHSVPTTSAGQLRVAVLSTPTRDATLLDPSTMLLHGAQVAGTGVWLLSVARTPGGKFLCNVQDVDRDRRPDLVCHFDLTAHALPPGTSAAILDARTFAGEPLRGQDTVRVVGH